jgi:hypothetical protein
MYWVALPPPFPEIGAISSLNVGVPKRDISFWKEGNARTRTTPHIFEKELVAKGVPSM